MLSNEANDVQFRARVKLCVMSITARRGLAIGKSPRCLGNDVCHLWQSEKAERLNSTFSDVCAASIE